jgi:hypothetical protein
VPDPTDSGIGLFQDTFVIEDRGENSFPIWRDAWVALNAEVISFKVRQQPEPLSVLNPLAKQH